MTKKSRKEASTLTGNGPFVLLTAQSEKELKEVLQVIHLMKHRIVVHQHREEIMMLFLRLTTMVEDAENKRKMRKLAELLNAIFDFRKLNNPLKTIGLETLETELFNLKKKLEGRDD